MVKAAFTGSFDPAHEGHLYVVRQAIKLGFKVLVFVANNSEKNYQHPLSIRRENAQKFLGVPCIAASSNNIGDEIKSFGCEIIIRGIRDEKDFRYEQAITDYNRRVNGIETIYIPAPPEFQHISSSAIKGISVCSIK